MTSHVSATGKARKASDGAGGEIEAGIMAFESRLNVC